MFLAVTQRHSSGTDFTMFLNCVYSCRNSELQSAGSEDKNTIFFLLFIRTHDCNFDILPTDKEFQGKAMF